MLITYFTTAEKNWLMDTFNKSVGNIEYVHYKFFKNNLRVANKHQFVLCSDVDGDLNDGEEIDQLRKLGNTAYIMAITNQSSWRDRTYMLDQGFDQVVDISKGRTQEGILAFHRAGKRREKYAQEIQKPTIKFGPNNDLAYDPNNRKLFFNGEPVRATAYEIKTLEALLSNPGIVSRTKINQKIYRDTSPENRSVNNGYSNTLDVFIKRLRLHFDAIYDEKNIGKKIIKTVRGRGYQIVRP